MSRPWARPRPNARASAISPRSTACAGWRCSACSCSTRTGRCRGGYLGVDLFFVLSGFLITSLLLAEHRETGRIDLWPFWVRRARRLFPALLSLMPAIALYARSSRSRSSSQASAPTRSRRSATSRTGARSSRTRATGSSSPRRRRSSTRGASRSRSSSTSSGRWSSCSSSAPLQAFDRSCSRVGARPRSRWWRWSCCSIRSERSRVYLGTDTRAAASSPAPRSRRVISPSTTFQPKHGAQARRARRRSAPRARLSRGGRSKGATVPLPRRLLADRARGARAHRVRRVAARRASSRACCRCGRSRSLGTISYGVYLWHWPVNVVLTPERVHVRGFWLHVIQFAVTFAIAIVSYRFLERPIRMRGVPFGRPLYMVPAAVALSVVLVVRGTYARALRRQAPAPLDASRIRRLRAGRRAGVPHHAARGLDGELARAGDFVAFASRGLPSSSWAKTAARCSRTCAAARCGPQRTNELQPQRDARVSRGSLPARA